MVANRDRGAIVFRGFRRLLGTQESSVTVHGAVLGVVGAERVRGANIAVYRKLRLKIGRAHV